MSKPEWMKQDSEQFRAKVKMVEEQIASKPIEEQAALRKSLLSNLTREQAIAWGRALGEDEVDSRRETGEEREERIRRAMAYAAWEFDGKPMGGPHLKEFGIKDDLTGSLDRAVFGRLLQKGKDDPR